MIEAAVIIRSVEQYFNHRIVRRAVLPAAAAAAEIF